MKKISYLAFLSILAVSSSFASIVESPTWFPSWLQGSLTGNVALTSNYVWRGISQTDNGPAIQSGITYTTKPGFYVGAWGSNVKFSGSTAYMELDPSVGYANKFNNGIGYDIGAIRYHYPQAANLNYNEYHVNASYSIFNAGVAYANNDFNSGDPGTYYSVGINYDIPEQYIYFKDVSVGATGGRSVLGGRAGPSYYDYSISIGKKLTKTVKFVAALTDTEGASSAYSLGKRHLIGTISMDL